VCNAALEILQRELAANQNGFSAYFVCFVICE